MLFKFCFIQKGVYKEMDFAAPNALSVKQKLAYLPDSKDIHPILIKPCEKELARVERLKKLIYQLEAADLTVLVDNLDRCLYFVYPSNRPPDPAYLEPELY